MPISYYVIINLSSELVTPASARYIVMVYYYNLLRLSAVTMSRDLLD